MDEYAQKKDELLVFLNSNDVFPTLDVVNIAKIFNIEYVLCSGWWDTEDNDNINQ